MFISLLHYLCILLVLSVVNGQHCSQSHDQCEQVTPDDEDSIAAGITGRYDVDFEQWSGTGVNVTESVREVTHSNGYVLLKQLFNKQDIAHAKQLLKDILQKQGGKATHFQGGDDSKTELQARAWNLLNKGKIWQKMSQHPTVLQIARSILGEDMQLGSAATNTIYPGGSGQEPHIDYPYWDYFASGSWPHPPKHQDVPFYMNVEAIILLDDFTLENGATAVEAGTQTTVTYPTDKQHFYENMVQVTGSAGDVVVFAGTLHHCAMPNHSSASRSALLLQYLPKYIRPMEDLVHMLSAGVLEKISPELRKLLLLDYPYPANLDQAEAENTEGFHSEFEWKG